MILIAKPGRNTASTVARNLCFGAIGIQQSYAEVSVRGGQNPLDAIGSDAIMTVADAACEGVNVAGRMDKIDDQEIVTARGRFDERNAGHISCAGRIVAKAAARHIAETESTARPA